MTHRLFLSISLPDIYLDKFEAWQEKYDLRDIRWTARQNLHLTVLFLGDVKGERVNRLINSLESIEKTAPFSLNFKELTLAPPYRPPRMIWAIFNSSSAFDSLVQKCFAACKDFCQIHSPYRQIPHITLARFRENADYHKIVLPHFTFDPLKVKKIHLVESTLTRQGPIYDRLQTITLKENGLN